MPFVLVDRAAADAAPVLRNDADTDGGGAPPLDPSPNTQVRIPRTDSGRTFMP
ncbi:hypothetical protein R4282_15355 [Rhodococcus oxybenzonivorans]|jgi:hypothetical protein|uniref:hypothetical protein n=1 Tax=Rhodococcus TaxID=1827 RepID=UPI0013204C9E|nr:MULTISPECIES: hypothetical protein [Rhodococcus]MDV7354380.1 hypothetical protein [Rhodococcus oxybenzonivorans]QHE67695.1 hypothetical protein GFS60_01196 [Rhodococcus sp. WAY2]